MPSFLLLLLLSEASLNNAGRTARIHFGVLYFIQNIFVFGFIFEPFKKADEMTGKMNSDISEDGSDLSGDLVIKEMFGHGKVLP